MDYIYTHVDYGIRYLGAMQLVSRMPKFWSWLTEKGNLFGILGYLSASGLIWNFRQQLLYFSN